MSRARDLADGTFSGEFAADSPTLVVDATNNRVGMGTSSPATVLELAAATNANKITFDPTNTGNNGDILGGFVAENDGAVGQIAIRRESSTTNSYISFESRPTGGALTERMRIDSNGYVGIGTTSSYPLTVQAGTTAQGNTHALALRNDSTANRARLGFLQQDSSTAAYTSIDGDGRSTGYLRFNTNDTERMRIDSSGNLLVGASAAFTSGGTNSGGNGAIMVARDNERCLFLKRAGGNGTVVEFIRGGVTSPVGSISITTTATSYNTSSDYRLKENVTPLDNAATRLAQIPVHRFNFIADPDTTVDGFLAHEVQAIVPEAVTGTKDGMREEEYEVTPAVPATYDEEGNVLTEAVPAVMGTRTVPDYQGIDQSKLVPLLTAALQEALQKIDALEARIATLEGGA